MVGQLDPKFKKIEETFSQAWDFKFKMCNV